jgi:hypothetical protein
MLRLDNRVRGGGIRGNERGLRKKEKSAYGGAMPQRERRYFICRGILLSRHIRIFSVAMAGGNARVVQREGSVERPF